MKILQHITVLILLLALLYSCVSLAGGTFNYREWDGVAATIFFVQSIMFLTIFLIGYVVKSYISIPKKEQ